METRNYSSRTIPKLTAWFLFWWVKQRILRQLTGLRKQPFLCEVPAVGSLRTLRYAETSMDITLLPRKFINSSAPWDTAIFSQTTMFSHSEIFKKLEFGRQKIGQPCDICRRTRTVVKLGQTFYNSGSMWRGEAEVRTSCYVDDDFLPHFRINGRILF